MCRFLSGRQVILQEAKSLGLDSHILDLLNKLELEPLQDMLEFVGNLRLVDLLFAL